MNDEKIKAFHISNAINGIERGRKVRYHLEHLIGRWTVYKGPKFSYVSEYSRIVVVPTDHDLQVVEKYLSDENPMIQKLAQKAFELGTKIRSESGTQEH